MRSILSAATAVALNVFGGAETGANADSLARAAVGSGRLRDKTVTILGGDDAGRGRLRSGQRHYRSAIDEAKRQ